MKHKLLIIGLGRVGLQVADLAIEKENIQVFGTVRQSSLREGCGEIDNGNHGSNGNTVVRVPFDPVAVRENLFGCKDDQVAASHVLFSIPLSREDDPIMEAVLNELKKWWKIHEEEDVDGTTKNSSDSSKVIGILSTTGVYGNHDGQAVTENSKLLCTDNSNAELYRQFEDDWISLSVGNVKKGDGIVRNCDDNRCDRRLSIFRCAGIYDSSRSALHTVYKNLETGKLIDPIQKLSSSVPTTGNKTNRIHSIDLARGVLSGMFHNENREDSNVESSVVRIYNLADNLPEVRSVVLSYAQELLASIGVDQSTFRADKVPTELAETTKNIAKANKTLLSRSSITRQRRRERESKFVCNKRMRDELLPEDGLFFPTYREGLRSIFDDPTTPWQQRQLKK